MTPGALLLTTHPGLEPLVADELAERAAANDIELAAVEPRPGGHPGHVRAELSCTEPQARAIAERMRSVHHVLRPKAVFELPRDGSAIEVIRQRVAALDFPELEGGASFRATTKRIGHHDFGSPDVERAVGEVLQRRWGAPVDLRGYDVCVRADVRNLVCTVGVQLTREPLSRRHVRPWGQRTGLKPTIAWAALRMAGPFEEGATVLDPFCGSATVLLEAGDAWPELRLLGSDRNPEAIRGARANLEANGLLERARIQPVDARDMARQWSDVRVQAVVTNPPYGERLARTLDFESFYARVLDQARPLLAEGGRIVLLASRAEELRRGLERAGGLAITRSLAVEMRSVTPTLFRIEPRGPYDGGPHA